MSKSVVCFGEILWDVLPDAKRPGGAPMNVAYHLQKLGLDSTLISSIGDDEQGAALLHFAGEIGLPTAAIQVTRAAATSEVIAVVDEQQQVSYEIIFPVAWDFIQWEEGYAALLENSSALVYGSLASRHEHSATTLLRLLKCDCLKVFDVNLRPPHYNFKTINRLLSATNLLKLNVEELEIISAWYSSNLYTEADRVASLFNLFDIGEILVTKGASGASYYTRDKRVDSPAFNVAVKDTIGSGDSFLAAFLSKKFQNEVPESALEYAVTMGAFITSQSGACPPYEKDEFETFFRQRRGKSEN